MQKIKEKQSLIEKIEKQIEKPVVWISLAIFSCILWGSAFTGNKLAYEFYQINKEEVFDLWLFAGTRFFLAGIFTLILARLLYKKLPKIEKKYWPAILILALFQTILQYLFYYVGLAHTTGVKASIIAASSSFISIILARLIIPEETINPRKILAIVIGFLGIIFLNLGREGLGLDFSLIGEGFMIFASLSGALAGIYTKRIVNKINPMTLTAWQLIWGSIVLLLMGKIGGGSFAISLNTKALLLIYLSLLSCFAFTIWTFLLKVHSLAKVNIFKASIPIFGSLISWLILKEELWRWQYILGLVLIVLGILIINLRSGSSLKD